MFEQQQVEWVVESSFSLEVLRGTDFMVHFIPSPDTFFSTDGGSLAVRVSPHITLTADPSAPVRSVYYFLLVSWSRMSYLVEVSCPVDIQKWANEQVRDVDPLEKRARKRVVYEEFISMLKDEIQKALAVA